MTTPWGFEDFDAHEDLHFITNEECGLKAIIAVHSTHLGPAAGGCRFWRYEDEAQAVTDALRLSRGMSYKNAMAGLPLGGGKSVILADANRTKTPEMLHMFGKAIDHLCGRYITAEDVGMSVADMIEIRRNTPFVAGLPVEDDEVGGDPGPHTSLGVFLGIKAAVRRALGKESVSGLHIALQGAGSVATGVALHAANEGARISIADVHEDKAQKLAEACGGKVVGADEILSLDADVLSPCALGAILTEESIPTLNVPIVAGGANNQLATALDGQRVHDRGIVFAPDYVINAGGIINVALEYLGQGNREEVESRIHQIPGRLAEIWAESKASGTPASVVADRMAQKLIGRG